MLMKSTPAPRGTSPTRRGARPTPKSRSWVCGGRERKPRQPRDEDKEDFVVLLTLAYIILTYFLDPGSKKRIRDIFFASSFLCHFL